MNVLFAVYGDFTSNSLNHIAGFAAALADRGHACAVAVAHNPDSIRAIARPAFRALTHAEALARPALFPDGRPADILHAWTPRENVRRFTLAYRRLAPSRVVVHLEDNEDALLETFMGRPAADLRSLPESLYPKALEGALSHPVRHRSFLRLADGATVIVETLRAAIPPALPTILLPPGLPPEGEPAPPARVRAELGLDPEERLIVFTGGATFANQREIGELYAAVGTLNRRGRRTRLVRTGINPPAFHAALPEGWRDWTIDLGFVEKARLPSLLAAADVLVQPGQPGPFNDLRLPSKLPEFLASGRPVVLPRCNVGLRLQDGVEAVVLPAADAAAIADACEALFRDPARADRIGRAGAAFARREFDLAAISDRLLAHYAALLASPPSASREDLGRTGELTALSRGLHATLAGVVAPPLPAWRDLVAAADELAWHCHELEESTLPSSTEAAALRARLEADVEHWRQALRLNEQHIFNLEHQVAATRQHAEQLERRGADLTAERDGLRRQLESEVATWKETWRLTDQHVRNIEATLEATRNHAGNLERVVSSLEGTLATSEEERTLAQTLLRSARQQMAAFERALAETESRLGRAEAEVTRLATDLASVRAELDGERRAAQEAATAARGERLRLENRLSAAEQQVVNLSDTLGQTEYQLAATRARALALGESARAEAADLRARLRDREEALASRERKVRAMQASASWQLTAPLRVLRRLLLDPWLRRPAPPPPPPALPPSALAFRPEDFGASPLTFRFSVDYPQSWSFSVARVVVRGWCLALGAEPLRRIRARVGRRIYPGTYGLKRMDVLAALRDVPQAEYCGFKIDVTLEEGDAEILLEVAPESGDWQRFFSSPLKVGPQHGQPELTSYERWAETYDRLTDGALAALRDHADRLPRRPLISILLPVYHRRAEDEAWLVKAVASVQAQVYSHWELCIADDASPAPHVRPLLERLAAADPRIRVVFRPANGHISAASNSALELVSGEFTALLDHDDELAPHALFEVAALLNAHPETDLIYSDEDKIDEAGRRHEPYFKPDFLPDLFLGQNYLSHLSVYRTALVRDVGGFRVGFEGSQDWDLALRVYERSDPARIRHIPKVLYHWRAIPGSTALLLSEKNYPVEAARKALAEHFARRGESVELLPVPGDHWRARRPRPDPAPRVTLVIPTRNGHALLARCIESIVRRTRYPNYDILVIDNGSDDPATLAYFRSVESDRVAVLRYDAPFNYSRINNHGVRHARGEIIGLLNNDLEVIGEDWLDEMVSQAVRPEIGCVGAMLYYPNDAIQHAGVVIGLGGVAGHLFRDFPRGTEGLCNRARLAQNYSAVTAACLVVRRSVFEQVGGLDEDLAVAFNDIDFCLRVRAAGYRNLWTPFAELYHHESASRGAEDTPEKQERFRREVERMLERWRGVIAHDPAYNPNLTLELTDASLAAPPRAWAPGAPLSGS